MQKQKPNKLTIDSNFPLHSKTILHTNFLETETLKPKSDLDTNQFCRENARKVQEKEQVQKRHHFAYLIFPRERRK